MLHSFTVHVRLLTTLILIRIHESPGFEANRAVYAHSSPKIYTYSC